MSISAPVIDVRAVSVGQPSVLHRRKDGRVVTSGIRKHHVAPGSIVIGLTNIEGDGQDDLINHGGVDKAVYVYPTEHLALWKEEIGYDGGDSPFGENLSISGITEDDAFIGDVWAWGEVRLQISQPRQPCSKLALRTGHMDMIRRFTENGRTGWYFRVLTPGTVDWQEPIAVEAVDSRRLSVREAFDAGVHRHTLNADFRLQLAKHPYLSDAWKAIVRDDE